MHSIYVVLNFFHLVFVDAVADSLIPVTITNDKEP